MQFQHKAPIVEAFRLPEEDDENVEEFHAWREAVGFDCYTSERDGCIDITNPAQDHITWTVYPGDWIVKSPDGTFAAWDNASFEDEFEPAAK